MVCRGRKTKGKRRSKERGTCVEKMECMERRGRDRLTAIESNPGVSCFSKKFSSAKLLVP